MCFDLEQKNLCQKIYDTLIHLCWIAFLTYATMAEVLNLKPTRLQVHRRWKYAHSASSGNPWASCTFLDAARSRKYAASNVKGRQIGLWIHKVLSSTSMACNGATPGEKKLKELKENSGHRNFCKTQNAFITGFAEMLWKIQVSINPPQESHHKTPKIKVSSPTKGPMASNDSQTNDVRLPLESVLLPQRFGLLCHQKGSPKCCRGAMPSPVDTWKETAVYRKTSVSKTADGCPKEAASWGGSKENHVSHNSLLGWEILFAKRKWEDSWFWIYAVSKPDCFHLQIDFLWLGTIFYRKTTWLCGNLVQISPSSTIFNGRKALSQCKRTPRQRSDMLRATETPPTSIRFRKQVSLKMGKVLMSLSLISHPHFQFFSGKNIPHTCQASWLLENQATKA